MSKDELQIQRIMDGLHCSKEEAKAIYECDKGIDHNEKMDFDLSADKQKIAQKMARTGTRKTSMKETGLNLKTRPRKENATKAAIIAEIVKFLNGNEAFLAQNVTILNKERQISFDLDGEKYEITLTQKRKPKN